MVNLTQGQLCITQSSRGPEGSDWYHVRVRLSLIISISLLVAGCRCVAGYEEAAQRQDGVARDLGEAGGGDGARGDGRFDAPGSDGRSDLAGDVARDLIDDVFALDRGADLAPDGPGADSVPYPDFGACPCVGPCPPASGVNCVRVCNASETCACPAGLPCVLGCAVEKGCVLDCRFAERCEPACSTSEACASIRCGGTCNATCAGYRSCAGMLFVGSPEKTTLLCQGPDVCVNATIRGGAGHTTVTCNLLGACHGTMVDLSASCGGRVSCLPGACDATTQVVCPASCGVKDCRTQNCPCP